MFSNLTTTQPRVASKISSLEATERPLVSVCKDLAVFTVYGMQYFILEYWDWVLLTHHPGSARLQEAEDHLYV